MLNSIKNEHQLRSVELSYDFITFSPSEPNYCTVECAAAISMTKEVQH